MADCFDEPHCFGVVQRDWKNLFTVLKVRKVSPSQKARRLLKEHMSIYGYIKVRFYQR